MSLFKNSILTVSTVLSLQFSTLPARADGGNLLGGVVVGAILYCGISRKCFEERRRGKAGDAVALDAEQRMMVQEGLAYSGYYDGAIDGAIGPASRQSILAYQKSVGAPETGYLTAEQITDLMRLSSHYRFVPDNDDRLFALEFGDTLAQDEVKLLQAGLTAQGYDAGTPDGLIGGNTRTAIAAFKDANGYDGPPVATDLLLARVAPMTTSNLLPQQLTEGGLIGAYETLEPSELNCESVPLIITSTEMQMYESVCQFPAALTGAETSLTANMMCNGEGEDFASQRTLNLEDDILSVIYEGTYAFSYRRCAAPDAATVQAGLQFRAPSDIEKTLILSTDIARQIDICLGSGQRSQRTVPVENCVTVADLDLDVADSLMMVRFTDSSFCGAAGCQTYIIRREDAQSPNLAKILTETYARDTEIIDLAGRNAVVFDGVSYLYDGETMVEAQKVARN